jgi:hypothetical protein
MTINLMWNRQASSSATPIVQRKQAINLFQLPMGSIRNPKQCQIHKFQKSSDVAPMSLEVLLGIARQQSLF